MVRRRRVFHPRRGPVRGAHHRGRWGGLARSDAAGVQVEVRGAGRRAARRAGNGGPARPDSSSDVPFRARPSLRTASSDHSALIIISPQHTRGELRRLSGCPTSTQPGRRAIKAPCSAGSRPYRPRHRLTRANFAFASAPCRRGRPGSALAPVRSADSSWPDRAGRPPAPSSRGILGAARTGGADLGDPLRRPRWPTGVWLRTAFGLTVVVRIAHLIFPGHPRPAEAVSLGQHVRVHRGDLGPWPSWSSSPPPSVAGPIQSAVRSCCPSSCPGHRLHVVYKPRCRSAGPGAQLVLDRHPRDGHDRVQRPLQIVGRPSYGRLPFADPKRAACRRLPPSRRAGPDSAPLPAATVRDRWLTGAEMPVRLPFWTFGIIAVRHLPITRGAGTGAGTPKETWAVITWVVYAVFLQPGRRPSGRVRSAAYNPARRVRLPVFTWSSSTCG